MNMILFENRVLVHLISRDLKMVPKSSAWWRQSGGRGRNKAARECGAGRLERQRFGRRPAREGGGQRAWEHYVLLAGGPGHAPSSGASPQHNDSRPVPKPGIPGERIRRKGSPPPPLCLVLFPHSHLPSPQLMPTAPGTGFSPLPNCTHLLTGSQRAKAKKL